MQKYVIDEQIMVWKLLTAFYFRLVCVYPRSSLLSNISIHPLPSHIFSASQKCRSPCSQLSGALSSDCNLFSRPSFAPHHSILTILFISLSKRFKNPALNTIDHAVSLISQRKNIVVLSGAGISVSCGIRQFIFMFDLLLLTMSHHHRS